MGPTASPDVDDQRCKGDFVSGRLAEAGLGNTAHAQSTPSRDGMRRSGSFDAADVSLNPRVRREHVRGKKLRPSPASVLLPGFTTIRPLRVRSG